MRDLHSFNEDFSDILESQYSNFVEFLLLFYKFQNSKKVILSHSENSELVKKDYLDSFKKDYLHSEFPNITDDVLLELLIRLSDHIRSNHNSNNSIKFISRLTNDEITDVRNSLKDIVIVSNSQKTNVTIKKIRFNVESLELKRELLLHYNSNPILKFNNYLIGNIKEIDNTLLVAEIFSESEIIIPETNLIDAIFPITVFKVINSLSIDSPGVEYAINDIIKFDGKIIGYISSVTCSTLDIIENIVEVVPIVGEVFATDDFNISGFVESVSPLVLKLSNQNFKVSNSYNIQLSDGTTFKISALDVGSIEELIITSRFFINDFNDFSNILIDSENGQNGVLIYDESENTSDYWKFENNSENKNIISGEIYNLFSYTVNNFIAKKMFELAGIRVIQSTSNETSVSFICNAVMNKNKSFLKNVKNDCISTITSEYFLNIKLDFDTNFGFSVEDLNFDEYTSEYGFESPNFKLFTEFQLGDILSFFGNSSNFDIFETLELPELNSNFGNESDVELIVGNELPIINSNFGNNSNYLLSTFQALPFSNLEFGSDSSFEFDFIDLGEISAQFGNSNDVEVQVNVQISEIISEYGMNLVHNLQVDDIGEINLEFGFESMFDL